MISRPVWPQCGEAFPHASHRGQSRRSRCAALYELGVLIAADGADHTFQAEEDRLGALRCDSGAA